MQTSSFFPVVIVGGGPTGLTLANLLGSTGTPVLVLESQPAVFPVPRATHLDEETLRNFQLTGLGTQLHPFTSPFGQLGIVNHLGKKIFNEVVVQQASLHGLQGSRFFDQPAFERELEQGLTRFSSATLLRGIEVLDIEQDSEKVTVISRVIATGETVRHTASWVVACDGGRSLVRTKRGISMTSHTHPRGWVIVDTLLHAPEDAALLPGEFQYVFNRKRLTIYAHGYGLNRRWEFQLNPGEVNPPDETVLEWLKPYVPEEKRTVVRIAHYAHQALVANSWRDGRILLAGDAAHMIPPAAGQGLCSGIRDAVNLAWKLAAVANGADDQLLQSYEAERKAHLHKVLARTLFFNSRVQGDTGFQRLQREWIISVIEALPLLKNYLRKRNEIPLHIQPAPDFPQSPWAGKFFPQWMDAPVSGTDDLVGYRWVMLELEPDTQYTQPLRMFGMQVCHLPATASPDMKRWMQQHRLKRVLIRPDKIIFSAA